MKISVYPELLADRFESKASMNAFLMEVPASHTCEQFEQILLTVYRGYGLISQDLQEKYHITVF
jgi:hypothetical protein